MGNTSSSSIIPPPNDAPPSTCPVDHNARSAWLQSSQSAPPHATPPSDDTTHPPPPRLTESRPLPSHRVISSIPRAEDSPQTSTPNPTSPPSPAPATEGRGGNWIYPSEKMFFEAMARKNHSPNAADMATVVPIHNAVNERAWSEIKSWESRFASESNKICDGPKLRSFSGDSKKTSPKARVNGWLGYERPFDRHDWVVERCAGGEVEYVIDFYKGKGGGLSFYLDVRPKLNSWEGWRMRMGRVVGL